MFQNIRGWRGLESWGLTSSTIVYRTSLRGSLRVRGREDWGCRSWQLCCAFFGAGEAVLGSRTPASSRTQLMNRTRIWILVHPPCIALAIIRLMSLYCTTCVLLYGVKDNTFLGVEFTDHKKGLMILILGSQSTTCISCWSKAAKTSIFRLCNLCPALQVISRDSYGCTHIMQHSRPSPMAVMDLLKYVGLSLCNGLPERVLKNCALRVTSHSNDPDSDSPSRVHAGVMGEQR
ncbi:uncharacterized protein MYCFIDRAFT_169513 [Pseudocercospora fijiensis CIRAD86]|uniref:Uncharacterized protein n=1 Tax=Pseudocercospora fijiensis (strain CIRAD86) TaxID=383855 RepID=N1Q7T6_PSEFD|nr:uncharacterized protein MYCFIDRAFT_169513 [Pseudocercospora fijiensis CIRAD86]EME87751.1 hypothetical protein MYCFIDRAFT_169513 [Pseudocercospora fijiensis CIRAD86]